MVVNKKIHEFVVKQRGKIGQSFDDYLKEEVRYEEKTFCALLNLMLETLDDIEKIACYTPSLLQ